MICKINTNLVIDTIHDMSNIVNSFTSCSCFFLSHARLGGGVGTKTAFHLSFAVMMR
jgi:hypothetical protein